MRQMEHFREKILLINSHLWPILSKNLLA